MDILNMPLVNQISAQDVKKAMDNKKAIVVLDVRTPGEYSRGKLEGSINLPLNEVQNKITSILPDKNSTVYVYCLSGSRSVYAVDIMVKLGYKNVFNMTSGLLAWRIEKYPVVL
jgi:phage shock protein E